MASHLERLRDVLKELFQLDQAELDFGIYRIMNAKRDEVTRFLDEDLLPRVRQVLATAHGADRLTLKAQLDEAVQQAHGLGVDPDSIPKVQELKAKYDATGDPAALEEQVFSHLASFLRRYYHEGDFISLRRYKPGVYAIPYEGEEVKLYWANHDQYYIKTSETLRDYTFKLPDGRRVHFKVVAADSETDNTKAAAGQERRFILAESDPLIEQDRELVIRFEHRPDPDKRKQAELSSHASRAILAATQPKWAHALAALRPTEKNAGRTLLDKHLADYTARNTFDYFIHKDLGGFLRRELDFYIKNEVMHLDDVEEATAPRVEGYLATVKAIRRIAHKIIDFLAQLENFQKKLWLKKKFVVETSWCVTLDRVPEALYPEIAANEAQRREWVRLFAIDDIAGDMHKPGHSEPLTVEFLKTNPFLVLDTALFSRDFTRCLLANLDNLDAQTDGLLVHGENFQALRLLHERYREQVKCIYIDPPYNNGKDGFPYKDNYQHSTWLAMVVHQLERASQLLAGDGALLCSIADHELPRLLLLAEAVFGEENHLCTFIWNTEGNIDNQSKIKQNHEYVVALARDGRAVPAPPMIDPNVGQGSKLFRDKIVNTIVKNGPANPQSTIVLPAGFPADFGEGFVTPELAPYPLFDRPIPVANGQLAEPLQIASGWSSRALLERFIAGGMKPIVDSRGATTRFFVKNTGAPYIVKERLADQSHVLTVLRNMGSTQLMASQLADMGFEFAYPKPLPLIRFVVSAFGPPSAAVLDFFAGSGTTGHAVIDLNREDGGKRKFILVEMADYFDTVLKPRILKVIYSKDWKGGKPVSREGSSALVKVVRIESYEDTLNNIELRKTKGQQQILDAHPDLREDYTLRYMLDVEGAGSLLDLDRLADPFAYTLKVATSSVGETRKVAVDLVETFSYLLGLRVKHVDEIRGVTVVEGTNPAGDKVLVLWRRLADTDNPALAEWFAKQGYNTQDQEYDTIYVNGDNTLENLRRPDQTWKVRLIEEELHRLMFDSREV